jgi:hypothetical protein
MGRLDNIPMSDFDTGDSSGGEESSPGRNSTAGLVGIPRIGAVPVTEEDAGLVGPDR